MRSAGARQVTSVLDRKEELLAALHRMNDEVEAGLHVDPATGRHCSAFQASYARVVLELKQARRSPHPTPSHSGVLVNTCVLTNSAFGSGRACMAHRSSLVEPVAVGLGQQASGPCGWHAVVLLDYKMLSAMRAC